jgi:hypothetical protein
MKEKPISCDNHLKDFHENASMPSANNYLIEENPAASTVGCVSAAGCCAPPVVIKTATASEGLKRVARPGIFCFKI